MKRSRKLTNIIFLIEMWSKLYRRIISEDKTTLGHGSYTDYQPVLEDWLWHTVFPLVSYTALLVAAIVLPGYPALALFVIAAGTVLLLFIGIHNALDNVIYIAIELSQAQNKSQD